MRSHKLEPAPDAVEPVAGWMRSHKLEPAPQKTECVILRGEREATQAVLKCERTEVRLKKNVKYLGITIGHGGRYGEHLRDATLKEKREVPGDHYRSRWPIW
ncbi:hypothetical protein QE152_g28534 [Popillia japonica]|uniref:Uncharacterized protein n=1 Tax=Popillia japonica TaxID=7064 RepID=A0AAW1JJA6_POPJA